MLRSSGARNVLLTGGTGYLGSLIAATLLTNEEVEIVLPVRAGYDAEALARPIRAEIEVRGGSFGPSRRARLHAVPLPPFDSLSGLDEAAREFGVREVIHCAGCLDYFDREALEAVNVDFTRGLLEQSRRWGVERFTYVSTAFSSGYLDSRVPERLHPKPASDPTDYTRTKREAEWLVAESGLPYLIVRPSIVIGDSRDGHYSGKQYGLYQLWAGMERLLCRDWNQDIHAFAPRQPLSLVHQDAFQAAFLAAYRTLPDGSILNLVSEHASLPDLRQLWRMWLEECLRPRFVYYYQKMSDIPVREINTRQRALLGLASVNLEIASHPWRFETTNLERLRREGLEFTDTTLETVAVCQRRFAEESSAIRDYLDRNAELLAGEIEFYEAGPAEAYAPAAAAD
ncbi:MAG TPA: SDR family oxidoreductase [Pyrinomonadaceae bacterium]|jgi:nucleoside-diphosphate-sugar epimerase